MMNRSQLEGSTEAIKWSMCLDIIVHCNGSLLRIIFSIKRFFQKKAKIKTKQCFVLPQASYGPEDDRSFCRNMFLKLKCRVVSENISVAFPEGTAMIFIFKNAKCGIEITQNPIISSEQKLNRKNRDQRRWRVLVNSIVERLFW